MADYKQTSIAGDSWVRSNRVVVENGRGGTPAITFAEERIINTASGEFAQNIGSVSEPFTNDNAIESFNLLNPETGAVIGSATYQEVYVMLHSLYMHIATKRDLQV